MQLQALSRVLFRHSLVNVTTKVKLRSGGVVSTARKWEQSTTCIRLTKWGRTTSLTLKIRWRRSWENYFALRACFSVKTKQIIALKKKELMTDHCSFYSINASVIRQEDIKVQYLTTLYFYLSIINKTNTYETNNTDSPTATCLNFQVCLKIQLRKWVGQRYRNLSTFHSSVIFVVRSKHLVCKSLPERLNYWRKLTY